MVSPGVKYKASVPRKRESNQPSSSVASPVFSGVPCVTGTATAPPPLPPRAPGEQSGLWLRSETLRGQRSCSGAVGGRMGSGDGSLEKFRKTEAAVPVSCSVDDVTGSYFVAALPCRGLWESPLSLFLPPGKTPLLSRLRLTACFAVLGTFSYNFLCRTSSGIFVAFGPSVAGYN